MTTRASKVMKILRTENRPMRTSEIVAAYNDTHFDVGNCYQVCIKLYRNGWLRMEKVNGTGADGKVCVWSIVE